MVRRVRPGHSLPELIVAVTFLATSMVAVGGMAVLGGRWTARAVDRQEAVRLAGAVLDSVAGLGAASTGSAEAEGFRVRWRVADGGAGDGGTDEGAGIRVVVSRGVDGPPLAVLWGRRLPPARVLPDEGAVDSAAVGPAPGSEE